MCLSLLLCEILLELKAQIPENPTEPQPAQTKWQSK